MLYHLVTVKQPLRHEKGSSYFQYNHADTTESKWPRLRRRSLIEWCRSLNINVAYSATFCEWFYFNFLELSQQIMLIALLAYTPSFRLVVCVRLLTPYQSRMGDLKQATLLPDQQFGVSVHIDDSLLRGTMQYSFCWSRYTYGIAKSIQHGHMAKFLFAHDQLASPLACHSAIFYLLRQTFTVYEWPWILVCSTREECSKPKSSIVLGWYFVSLDSINAQHSNAVRPDWFGPQESKSTIEQFEFRINYPVLRQIKKVQIFSASNRWMVKAQEIIRSRIRLHYHTDLSSNQFQICGC